MSELNSFTDDVESQDDSSSIVSSPETHPYQLASEISILDRPKGGCFLFNQSRFSPTRTDATPKEVKDLLDKIKTDGASHLDQKALDFLVSNEILVPGNATGKPSANMTGEQWQNLLQLTPFTIRLNADLDTVEKVLTSIDVVLQHFDKSGNDSKKPHLQIKYICRKSDCNDWLECMTQIIPFVLRSVERENVSFFAECPIEIVIPQVDQLLQINRPSIIVNLIVSQNLSQNCVSVLTKMAQQGFRPHLTFHFSNVNLEQVRKDLDMLLSELGNKGFTYSLTPQLKLTSSDTVFSRECSAFADNLIDFIDYFHFNRRFTPSQSWLYHDLFSRTIGHSRAIPFPCYACAGKAIFINQDGSFYSCHKQAAYVSPVKQNEIQDALSNPTKNYYGQSSFARTNCDQCSLRNLCGGLCPYLARQTENVKIQQHIFQIHCRIRKHLLMHFFEEATTPIADDKQPARQYRFVSGDGRLDVVPLDQQEQAKHDISKYENTFYHAY